jgi:hypothetical protein
MLDFAEFQKKLDALCAVVMKLSCARQDLDITRPIFGAVADGLADAQLGAIRLRAFFFNFAQVLLTMKDGAELQQHTNFLNQCALRGHKHSHEMAGSDYAEYLTATSLALYFLGQPFSQPWERVLSWVEREGEGLPNGACVAKAIGEIIRSARIANCRARPATTPLLMFSHMPIILFKSYVEQAEVVSCVPQSAHLLGHCYELLQMRLYANEKLPFTYFVPRRIVQAKLRQDRPGEFDTAWKEALDWLCGHVFQHAFPNRANTQFVVLVGTETLQPVFLNATAGLYTSARLPVEEGDDPRPTPLPATFLRKVRVKLYRKTLESIPLAKMENLLGLDRSVPNEQARVRTELFGV